MFRRPFILSAVAVTALLALAASAAYTRPLTAAGRRSGALPSSLIDYTFTTLVIVAIVLLILLLPFIRVEREGHEQRHPARALRTIGFLIAAVVLIIVIFSHLSPQTRHLLLHLGLHLGPAHRSRPARTPHTGPVGFRWDELFAVLGLGALLVLLVFALRRPPPEPDASHAETLAEAISGSLDDLRFDSDPRRAIVAAYARMERALAASGVPRDPAEAPHEYLERALLAVDASAGAARRLTELFERAKFSQHEPDAQMRDEAIDALEAIRDELSAGNEVAA
jgi:hypothetical protein